MRRPLPHGLLDYLRRCPVLAVVHNRPWVEPPRGRMPAEVWQQIEEYSPEVCTLINDLVEDGTLHPWDHFWQEHRVIQ